MEPEQTHVGARDVIERAHTAVLLLVLVAVHIALHARWLNMPPAGFHLWRQTQALSVARNFYEEGLDPLRPRVDSRGATSGITGMEFPLVNAAIAVGYRMFGFHHGLHRVVMLLLGVPAILGMMALGRALLGTKTAGLLAGALLVTNPLFVYYSVCALPEVPMLGALLLGMADLVSWSRSLRSTSLIRGVSLLSLAGLLKLSSASAWPAAFLLTASGFRRATPRQRVLVLVTSAAGLALVTAWYLWARHLSARYGNHDFLLEPLFPFRLKLLPGILRSVFIRWLPEVYVSYPQFVLVLIGVAVLVGSRAGVLVQVIVGWTVGLVVYGTLVAPHLVHHDYYMVPATPMLLVLATVGLQATFAAAWDTRRGAWVASVVVGATLFVGPYRGLTRLARGRHARDLTTIEASLQPLMPDRDALVVAANDPSPSIDLYFMHRKGWAVTDRISAKKFEDIIRDGARYLVSDSRRLEQRPEVARHLRPVGASGQFQVFEIAPDGAAPPA